MNYQKLSEALLRVLGIWLPAQCVLHLWSAAYMYSQSHNFGGSVSSTLRVAPLWGATALTLATALFFESDRLSRLIADEN